MECPHCGEQISQQSRFCPQCGGNIGGGKLAAGNESDSTTPQNKLRSAANRGADDLGPEVKLWEGTYSKFAMIGAWVGAAVVSLASVVIGLFGALSGGAWLAIVGANAALWLALVARYFYLRFSRHYTLTNQRFTHMRGLLWRQTDRIETIDIDDVAFNQGPIERMFGIGTVRITSSDQSHPELSLPGIENVQTVAASIDDARRNERRRRGLYIESV
jgi:membrane protein YdbS with pleckstrin-like domain